MTFLVNGIKQDKEEKQIVEILLHVSESLLARKILEEHGILILSLKEFLKDPSTFGDIYFTIKHGLEEITIGTLFKDIKEAATFFIYLGFDIISINSYSRSYSDQEIFDIINQAKKNAFKRKELIIKENQQKENEEKILYSDKYLQTAKILADKVLQKGEQCIKKIQGKISFLEQKKLLTLQEDLKKFKMGNNFEKIRDTIEEILTIIETINEKYFEIAQSEAMLISPDSLITTVDVEREIDKLENIKILKKLGIKIPIKNQDYAFFGIVAIFWKFIQKDILFKLSDIQTILYILFDLGEFLVLILLILLGIYILNNEKFLFVENQYLITYSLISIGVRGISIFLGRCLRKKNIGRLFLLIGLTIGIYYLLFWLIRSNFAI